MITLSICLQREVLKMQRGRHYALVTLVMKR